MAEAKKYDGTKVSLALFPMRAYIETCQVLHFGAEAYDIGNWHNGQGFNYGRLASALQRHYAPWLLGEDNDPDSGRNHIAHLICEAAFVLESQLCGVGVDDRDRYQISSARAPVPSLIVPQDLLTKAQAKRSAAGANAVPKDTEQNNG